MPRIVLAEDDETMARLLRTLLRLEGFEVETVGSEEDVKAVVERVGPDILVLDMVLSRENGLEVLDELRSAEAGEGLYVLMISGLDVREECRVHGADDFLLKPFMPEDLLSRLRSHLPSAT